MIALPSDVKGNIDFYVFGWTGEQLKMLPFQLDSQFNFTEASEVRNVLSQLSEWGGQRYNLDQVYMKNANHFRVRIQHICQVQDRPNMVFSRPWSLQENVELPYIFCFTLVDGELFPSDTEFAIERVDTEKISSLNEFSVYNNSVLFAKCQRKANQDGLACGQPLAMNSLQWQPVESDALLFDPVVIPG